jgi:hypothetical protein
MREQLLQQFGLAMAALVQPVEHLGVADADRVQFGQQLGEAGFFHWPGDRGMHLDQHVLQPVGLRHERVEPRYRGRCLLPGLGAQPVALLVDDAIDVKAADQFIEMLLTYDEDVVIDSGAASFLPLSSYLIETEIAALLDAAGRELVIHTIVTGGGSFMDTARGLEAVVEDFPPTATLIVWTNEYFGPVRFEDVAFEDTPVYRNAKPRIAATVHLKRQNPQSFGANLATLLERKQTFDEALAGTTFNTVERQRLAMIQREVFEQLAGVVS